MSCLQEELNEMLKKVVYKCLSQINVFISWFSTEIFHNPFWGRDPYFLGGGGGDPKNVEVSDSLRYILRKMHYFIVLKNLLGLTEERH